MISLTWVSREWCPSRIPLRAKSRSEKMPTSLPLERTSSAPMSYWAISLEGFVDRCVPARWKGFSIGALFLSTDPIVSVIFIGPS